MRHVAVLLVATACAASRAGPPIVALPNQANRVAPATTTQDDDVETGALAVRDDVAYVADEDPPSVRAFDALTLAERWSVRLDGAPAHLAIDGDRVLASIRARDRVDVIDPKTRKASVFARPCVEPIGLATGAAGEIFVACGWDHELVALSSKGETLWRVDLPSEPRAVLVKDGRAFVSHAAGGNLSIVDTKTHVARAISLFAGVMGQGGPKSVAFGSSAPGLRLVASNGFALVEHGGTVYAPAFVGTASLHQYVSATYYGGPFQDGVVYEIDGSYDQPGLAARLVVRREHGCFAPRGVAVRSAALTLVACPGEDALVEQARDGIVTRRLYVGAGPSAIVVDRRRDEALVWSQETRTLTRVNLVTAAFAEGHATGAPETNAVLRHGREIFEATNDRRITSDGRGCVTCHPDGRADGFTWGTPEGPRNTLMLAGRVHGTAPYGWTRGIAGLPDYIAETMRRLGGNGLPREDLDALARYVESMRAPSSPHVDDVSRGRAIFESAKTGCASCHAGPQLTDHRSHVVIDEAVDTPSLLYVSHTAPYLHDGRSDTLDELLTETEGSMGHTTHLSPADRSALLTYLRSL